MKTAVGVGRISPNGTLSIPEAMLRGMAFQKGGDVVMVQGRESIMIKPVRKPDRRAALKRLFAWGDEIRRKHNLKREDIDKTIKEVRRARRPAAGIPILSPVPCVEFKREELPTDSHRWAPIRKDRQKKTFRPQF